MPNGSATLSRPRRGSSHPNERLGTRRTLGPAGRVRRTSESHPDPGALEGCRSQRKGDPTVHRAVRPAVAAGSRLLQQGQSGGWRGTTKVSVLGRMHQAERRTGGT